MSFKQNISFVQYQILHVFPVIATAPHVIQCQNFTRDSRVTKNKSLERIFRLNPMTITCFSRQLSTFQSGDSQHQDQIRSQWRQSSWHNILEVYNVMIRILPCLKLRNKKLCPFKESGRKKEVIF